MSSPIPSSFFSRLGAAARYAVSGTAPESWFGPQKPLEPQAPPDVKGRQWDYPFGANLNYTPRSEAAISFHELRALADALPLLRLVIETRKDQIAGLSYTVRSRDPRANSAAAPRIASTLAFLARPDRRHSFATWLRLWLEDMLVLDAATLYPRLTRGGDPYSIDVIDGSTITPLIAEDGRTPEPPDPAYQQVLHGVPAADFTSEELLYLPRNPRPHRLYGMSPVEQVALTINIALRRDMATLDYYKLGSTPDAFATLPKDWTIDQIRQFQDYFDALMSGNSARRRMVKFMPSGFELRETRQPPLKDQYDEWLARVICYAFSIPPSPFVNQTNRATSETLRAQAAQEGLVPLKAWVKGVLDEIVQVCLKQPDLEFAWVGDDAVDPLQQAQTLSLLVGAGIKTREEARAELGLAPEPSVEPGPGQPIGRSGKPVAKYNPYHDERGRFTTPDGAVEPGGGEAPAAPGGSPPAGTEVAEIDPRLANPGVISDVPSTPVAPDANPTNAESPLGIVGSVELVDPQGASDPASSTSDFTDETSTIWQIARRLVSAAIETLGADAAEATAAASSLAGAILIGSTTSTGDPNYGAVPGRPDVSFEWNPVTGKIQFFQTGQADQIGRTLIAEGQIGKVPGVFLDSQQRILALEVADSGGYVFANVGLIDAAVGALRSPGEAPQAADDSSGQGDALQVFYNPDTKEIRVAPAGASSNGTLPPGFIAAWTIGPGGQVVGATPDGRAPATPSDRDTPLVDPKLIDQLVASGVKITPAKVVATGAMADGRVVWLETGDADRGLQHIVERHGSEFAQMGATEADIPQIVINAVTQGIFLGYQGAKKDTPIFVTMVQGQLWKIAVTIGSNGFIVAANSKGRVR